MNSHIYDYVLCQKDGILLYMACGSSGSVILNYNAPTPVLVGTYSDFGYAYSVYKSSDGSGRIFIGEMSSFEIINATNPASPTELCNYTLGTYPVRDFVMVGSYVCVACDGHGIRSFDVSNPTSITTGSTVLGLIQECLAVVHHPSAPIVLAAVSEEGLIIVNKTDPDDMIIQTRYCDYGNAVDVHVGIHQELYVANGFGGMEILNVTDPMLPTLLGKVDTPGYAYSVSVWDDLACIADGTSGRFHRLSHFVL